MTTPPPPTITLGGEEYAVVPRAEYEALRNAVDEDAMDAAIIQRVLEDPDQELVPFELVKRIAGWRTPGTCVARLSQHEGRRACRRCRDRGLLSVGH